MMINIIVADDYSAVRQVICDYFFYYSTQVKVIAQAGTGKEVLELVDCLRVDAVLLDILMPEINGLEVIKILRQAYPTLLIIAFSGDCYANYQERALDAGADYYIPKPYDLGLLEEMIVKELDFQPCYRDTYKM